jgi:hypothetical protein
MALPTSINTVYAPGSQIKSDDLNDIQTSIVGHEDFLKDPRPRHVNPAAGQLISGTGNFLVSGRFSATAAASIVVPLPVSTGERITAISAVIDPGALAVTIELWRVDSTNVATSLGTASSSGSSLQTLSISGLTEVVTSRVYALHFGGAQTGDVLVAIFLTVDVP